MILRSYKDRNKLEALAKLTSPDEGFDDRALHLEAMRSLLPLPGAHVASDGVTEEEVLDGVMALEETYLWMQDLSAIPWRAGRVVRLLGRTAPRRSMRRTRLLVCFG